MRKIVAGLFMSLDGVIDGPGSADPFEKAGWSMPYFVPEMGEHIRQSGAASDGLLIGRVTYEAFQSFFEGEGSSNPSAEMMNSSHKYVVSNTLKEASWANSSLISGDVIAEISRLRAQAGQNLNISGSIALIHSLFPHGLIDQLDLFVAPVIVGTGRRLFPEGFSTGLKLLEHRTFSTGALLLSYAVDNAQQGPEHA